MAAAVAALALSLAAPSLAARAPSVEVEVGGSAYVRTVTVRVAGPKKRAIRNATVHVTASMTAPGHFMSVGQRRAGHTGRGVYRAQLRFPMLGRWTLVVRVEGPGLRPVTKRLAIGL